MSPNAFVCDQCGRRFTVPPSALARYPGWRPRTCLDCRREQPVGGSAPAARRREVGAAPDPEGLSGGAQSPAVDGPSDGVFTDGACSGNPGPGGWAAVHVVADAVVEERHGAEPRTTNNRMELRALIEAYRMLPADSRATIWSDSNLCVQTINVWAAGWQRRGWKRKTGPVENLDLVREAYDLARQHPRVRLVWLRGHAGKRWNEYADRLATAPLRQKGER